MAGTVRHRRNMRASVLYGDAGVQSRGKRCPETEHHKYYGDDQGGIMNALKGDNSAPPPMVSELASAAVDILGRRPEVMVAYLYGSVLRTDEYRDIDIGLLLEEGFRPPALYEGQIARDFEGRVRGPFDIRVLNGRPARFLFSVIRQCVILHCKDEGCRVEFEKRVMKEYSDMRYYHDRYDRARRTGQRERGMSRDIIESKVDVIERHLKFLEEYQQMAPDAFLSSFKDVQAAKYSLLEVIEPCIDIAARVVSAMGLERGESYAELFLILARHRIVDHALAERLAAMVRFRNILVYGYPKTDNMRVLQLISGELGDITDYVRQVLTHLYDQ